MEEKEEMGMVKSLVMELKTKHKSKPNFLTNEKVIWAETVFFKIQRRTVSRQEEQVRRKKSTNTIIIWEVRRMLSIDPDQLWIWTKFRSTTRQIFSKVCKRVWKWAKRDSVAMRKVLSSTSSNLRGTRLSQAVSILLKVATQKCKTCKDQASTMWQKEGV